jgi:mRNA interferase HigB
MRIIKKTTLEAFWIKHFDSKKQLEIWYFLVLKTTWKNLHDVKNISYMSILSNSRVVFNIKGNDYRMITEINFNAGIVYICWIGTYSEYDRIAANTVWDY